MKPSQGNIHKILVVTLSNLGDVVLTLPVFQTLRETFPDALIDGIVGKGAAAVFQNDARLREVTLYNKKISWAEKILFIKRIREKRYDLIIDLRYSAIGLLGGGRFRNRYTRFYRFFESDTLKKNKHKSAAHLLSLKGIVPERGLEENIRAANELSFEWMRGILKNKTTKDAKSFSFDGSKLIVCAVGSKSDIKKWPTRYFASLLDRLATQHQYSIVLIGSEEDRAAASEVKSRMRTPVIDLCGQTSFSELCHLLTQSQLLITNDSAPLHIADALRVPVLALFGPTDPRSYGPRYRGSEAVKQDTFCSPCEKAQCRYGHECMLELKPDQVYKRALKILNHEFQPKNINILVFRLDRIGDVVLSLPALRAIRRRFPNANISVVVRHATQDIVQAQDFLDEVIPYQYERGGRHSGLLGNIRFIQEIRKRSFDMAFILHPSTRSHWVPFLAGIPYRAGFDSQSSFLLSKKIPDRRHRGEKHESDYALDIIRAYGIELEDEKEISFPIFSEERIKIAGILEEASWNKQDTIVALHPGASCPSKRWQKERFALLAKKVLENTSCRIAIVGGEETREAGDAIARQVGDSVLDLTGQLNLKELAAFLAECDVLVSNDSGPVHIAAAVGTKTLTIFGRNRSGLSVNRWRALGEVHRYIKKDVGCVVCLAHNCTIDFECLKAVEVDEVFSILTQMLSPEKQPVS